jgi:hypothetical protein
MAHPHLLTRALGPDAARDGAFACYVHKGAAEFAILGRLNQAAKLRRQCLLPVTNPQHRHAKGEYSIRCARAFAFGHAGRPARQNNAARRKGADAFFGRVIEGPNFAINAGFPHAAGNQLRHLATEIEDQHMIVPGGEVVRFRGHVGLHHKPRLRAS